MSAKFLFTEQFAFSKGDSVVVAGLGRFGSSVAQSLIRLGHDVMGIDRDPEALLRRLYRLCDELVAPSQ